MAGLVVGVPKEIKDKEGRVSVQPDGVAELVYDGREVVVQAGAGSGCGFPDDEYVAAGARVVGTADEVFAAADLIVKVKEPIPEEYDRFRPGQQLFTYLHLAADRRLTEFLLDRRIGLLPGARRARASELIEVEALGEGLDQGEGDPERGSHEGAESSITGIWRGARLRYWTHPG